MTREETLKKRAVWQRDYANRLREMCLVYYGGNPPKCACCGEMERKFLAIDHIDGGGTKHRKSLKNSGGSTMYLWIKRNNFPKGFQILCHNCNQAKGYYGNCPHEEKQEL